MQIETGVSLKPFNTFGIKAAARQFARLQQLDDLGDLPIHGDEPMLIIGGGSNILFTRNVEGLVLKNELKGIEVIGEKGDIVLVKAAAGENWHAFVMYCIANQLAGVENLALIPGCVGASPMQNIGAYGIEIKDVFHSLEAYDLEDRKIVTLNAEECEFGYRESVFKKRYKGRFLITSVTYALHKTPSFHTSYGAIRDELERMHVQELSIAAVAQAVINIRRSKLPDPAVIGNAGSFFKNPEVSMELYESVKAEHPAVVGYPLPSGNVKLAAGWLIEQCGWKGYRSEDAGCHDKQALVLVNYGHATGAQIFDLSQRIMDSVEKRFGVHLEREVNVI